MTWFRVDDTFALHPKVIAAGNAAVGLWIRCGCWSAAQLTDGRIPHGIAAMFGTAKDAAALERAGLWRSDGDAWIIDDWLEYQPSAAEVRGRRAETSRLRSEAGRRGGIASGKVRRGEPDEANEANVRFASSKTEANTKQTVEAKRTPDPTRPDPYVSKSPPPPQVCTDPAGNGGGGFDQRYGEALDRAVDAALAAEPRTPAKPDAWRAAVRRRIDRDHGAAISQAIHNGATPTEAARHAQPDPLYNNPLRGAWTRQEAWTR